ncbi:MAG TPA: NADH-quinone oxidoreductase subunit NuoG [Oleiagrimonas sp.]|nr:NADH-quinone oxidoreductase subunit NuoG [Oleiagrimonas sp.]
MSAQPEHKDENLVDIEIDGKALKAPKGSMIIQAADKVGISIPRFCYHDKLTIAANCRMCLVEVEMNGKPMPKPQPACSTPVGDGMKIATQSGGALKAQRNVMEFLLINHPLDCPVCDQGGECELQDVALGYGRGVSRFTERKRAVADENIGPLVATEMTRCIHCTRCVRFMSEIAGTNELGGMSRGENLVIGTYIGKSIESELSGNIIDVCPVGALTSKPFQFRARAWELIAKPSIGYHDALGSNLWLHTRRGEILRTVPRDNEAINECWLSDRDRYSHEGMYADDRVLAPRVKRDGHWQEVDWDEGIDAAVAIVKGVSGDDLGVLVHPATSNEEGALLKRLAKGLGSPHIDHRLRHRDFADRPVARAFGMPVAQFDKVDAALIVGSDTRSEMPLLHQRLRQACRGVRKHAGPANRTRFDVTLPQGAALYVLNPAHFSFNYDLAGETVVAPQKLVDETLALAAAAAELTDAKATAEGALGDAVKSANASDSARATVKALHDAESAVVLLGEVAVLHPQASWLRAATRFVAEATGSAFAEIPVGANAVGLAREDVLPESGGLDARAMLEQPRKACVLYGAEAPHDFADGAQALAALKAADKVVAFAAFASPSLLEVADVILPLALMPETDATLVNVDGVAQQQTAGARAPGEARSGWKILRALGGALGVDGFTFTNLVTLHESMSSADDRAPDAGLAERPAPGSEGLVRLSTIPIYRGDAVLRRAGALNQHPLNRGPAARVCAADAERLGLSEGDTVKVGETSLPVVVDADVAPGSVWIEAAYDDTATLPPYGATIQVSKA